MPSLRVLSTSTLVALVCLFGGTPAGALLIPDADPPETTILSGPPATTASRSATFSFTADEFPAVFQCSLDGAVFFFCSSPVS
jgi:hypothetical protein